MLLATRTVASFETVRVSAYPNLPEIVYFRIPSDGYLRCTRLASLYLFLKRNSEPLFFSV